MSPPLIISAYSLLFLVIFSLSLFAFILARRLASAWYQARFNRLYGEIEQDIMGAITRLNPLFSQAVALRHKGHPKVLTKVLIDFWDIIVGEGREQLRIIFNRAIRNRCLRHLRSRRTTKRLQSIRLFFIFFDPTENIDLHRLLNDKPIVKLAVISALARIPSPETMRQVFKAFEEDSGATVRSYLNIMFNLGGRIEPLVKASLKKPISPEKLGLLVELVGAIPLRSLYEEVNELAKHPEKEIRIRVARTLGKLLLPESVQTLVSLASDEAWEVQAQAVKSLAKLADRDTLDILTRSLFSPFWHVRYNAGYGLGKMGDEGIRQLEKVAAQQEDTYARDMSIMVLNDLINITQAT